MPLPGAENLQHFLLILPVNHRYWERKRRLGYLLCKQSIIIRIPVKNSCIDLKAVYKIFKIVRAVSGSNYLNREIDKTVLSFPLFLSTFKNTFATDVFLYIKAKRLRKEKAVCVYTLKD